MRSGAVPGVDGCAEPGLGRSSGINCPDRTETEGRARATRPDGVVVPGQAPRWLFRSLRVEENEHLPPWATTPLAISKNEAYNHSV